MPEYLVYFQQQWVPHYSESEFVEIAAESRALVATMREAGVLVFGGGLEQAPPLASADATSGDLVVSDGPHRETEQWIGGFTIIDVADEAEARRWTGAIAEACRWPQELRAFMPGTMRGW